MSGVHVYSIQSGPLASLADLGTVDLAMLPASANVNVRYVIVDGSLFFYKVLLL